MSLERGSTKYGGSVTEWLMVIRGQFARWIIFKDKPLQELTAELTIYSGETLEVLGERQV